MSRWIDYLWPATAPCDKRRRSFHPRRRYTVEHLESRCLLAGYNWQNVAIGAGGFVDGIFYDTHNQNVIYARTDIGGLYKTTNDGTTWTQLLDFVGGSTSNSGNGTQSQFIGVLSFAIDPENSNNIYADVGEYSGTNGAVFYSTNGGQTWGQTNLSFYVGGNSDGRATGERIAVDPYNSNIVFLGSNDHGLWKSTDAGHSFSQVSSFSTTASVNFVLFNPYGGTPGSATQNIFVGLNSTAGLSPQTTAPEPSNVWQTTDGGTTWNQIVGTGVTPGRNIVAASVSSISRSGGTATAHTAAANAFLVGDRVTIAGASTSSFNGTFTITGITNSTTFTYSQSGSSSVSNAGITAAINGSWMANRAALAPDGNLYVAYSNGLAPNSSLTNGGVFRYNTSTGVWANISPDNPQVSLGSFDQFGYVGLALDPQSSTTIVVTSFDRYAVGDAIWRTANANAASPTWTALFQFQGYTGNNTTRNTSTAPWVAEFDDGIGNWAGSVAVNPYNSAQLMYGTGQGIWATNNGTSNSTLTAANSWYFPDTGIEFTAVGGVAAPTSGIPLYSAMGDIGGFAHTTLTTSPSQGSVGGSGYDTDFAGTVPSNAVIVGSMGTNNGIYSTNGSTFTAFAANPGGDTKFSQGTVAISADGATIVWTPNGQTAYYSTNHGTTWTQSTLGASGALPTGGTIVADKVNANYFYYSTENGSDNVWTLYISSDGGHTFNASAGGTLGTGNPALMANPYVAGDLWLSSYIGVYHSSNFGASFTHSGSFSMGGNTNTAALGAAAPGQSTPAIYVFGTLNSFQGIYRSDDAGNNWTLLNDTNHQWGGLIQTVAADPNVFGRVYLGVNGRGVIMGNPSSSVPAGWTDVDINNPGNPGWAVNSTTLSSGSVVNGWIVDGGGAGVAGSSDQFNFAYTSVTGSAAISAQLTGLTNADGANGTPEAGVMMRASTNSNDPFAEIVQTSGNSLVFKYRTTTGGIVSTVTLGSIPVGAEYVQLVDSDNQFSAYYSSNGTSWTQLGITIAIGAMPATYNAGLAATANYNAQLTSAKFAQVTINNAPTIVNVAAAAPNPVPGTTTSLSALGTDNAGEANLKYTWTATGPAAVMYSANGTNAAKNSVATFTKAGNYNFTVTVTDAGGLTVTSSISVTVNQTLAAITLTPSLANIFNSQSQQLTATALDQFGDALAIQPTFTWTLDGTPIGSVDSSGLYTASSSAIGTDTVRVTSGAVSNTATVSVSWLRGDLNGDGKLTAPDVSALMFALSDLAGYQMQRGVNILDMPFIADVNTDGSIDNRDIQELISLVANTAPVGGGSAIATANTNATKAASGATALPVVAGISTNSPEQVPDSTKSSSALHDLPVTIDAAKFASDVILSIPPARAAVKSAPASDAIDNQLFVIAAEEVGTSPASIPKSPQSKLENIARPGDEIDYGILLRHRHRRWVGAIEIAASSRDMRLGSTFDLK